MNETRVIDRRVGEPATAASIREVSRVANRILSNDVIQSILRGPVTVAFTGAQTIRCVHGLGHPITGYLVFRLSAPVIISDGTFAQGDDPNQVAYIASSGAATVSLLFF